MHTQTTHLPTIQLKDSHPSVIYVCVCVWLTIHSTPLQWKKSESIDSFQKLDYEQRNPIIFNHPELPFKTYREYKKSLIKIIEKRKKMYEVLSCSEDDSD